MLRQLVFNSFDSYNNELLVVSSLTILMILERMLVMHEGEPCLYLVCCIGIRSNNLMVELVMIKLIVIRYLV